MSTPIVASGIDPTKPRPLRDFRYYELLVNAFVVILLISNLVAQKLVKLGPLTLSGAQLLFPITYILATCSRRSTVTPALAARSGSASARRR